jgi:hypothetical protein
MVKHHYIVIKALDGSPSLHAMKPWLRKNPENLPPGFSPDENSSHALRRALRKKGWVVEKLADRVLVIQPDETGETSFADGLLEEEGDIPETQTEEELAEADEITFGLERDLQAALRSNIAQLEPGLTIIDGGKERVTDAGRIDITAADNAGNIVVIELKAGMGKPSIVAQVLSYMALIAESDKKPVRGLIVAGDFHSRVVMACRAIPNLDLRKYTFQFSFRPIA